MVLARAAVAAALLGQLAQVAADVLDGRLHNEVGAADASAQEARLVKLKPGMWPAQQ